MNDIVKNKNLSISLFIKGIFSFIISTAVAITIFAAIIYFAEIGFEYAPLFGTVSVALGTFVTAYIVSKSIGKKGYITGFIIALAIFIIVTLVSLIIDDGSITANTLFHFIIYILSGIIGGVLGVNKKANTKYI